MSHNQLNNRHHTAEFKARLVLELLRGEISHGEACEKYELKESMLSRWKKEFLDRAPMVFASSPKSGTEERIKDLEALFKEQSLELAILKKAFHRSPKPSGDGS